MKSNYIFQNRRKKTFSEKVAMFDIFANLFHFWSNRRQPPPLLVFYNVTGRVASGKFHCELVREWDLKKKQTNKQKS